jgi:methanethiol S-methyltransferase
MPEYTASKKIIIRFLGALAYLGFFIAFAGFALFLLDVWPLRIKLHLPSLPNNSISNLVIDLGLILFFGLHHSVAARPRIKRWVVQVFSAPLERSAYVFASSALLLAICVFWQPLPGSVWKTDLPLLRAVILLLFVLGLLIAMVSTFLIDHAALVGLRQSGWCRSEQDQGDQFRNPGFYRYVRHPMQLGILIMLWATPGMSTGHALLSAAMTAYILIGLYFEERALLQNFGQAYAAYQNRVGMLIPRPWNKKR